MDVTHLARHHGRWHVSCSTGLEMPTSIWYALMRDRYSSPLAELSHRCLVSWRTCWTPCSYPRCQKSRLPTAAGAKTTALGKCWGYPILLRNKEVTVDWVL